MRIALSALVLVLAPGPGQAQTDPEKIADLVTDLNSPKYAQREAAMRKLEAVGEAALPALKQAAVRGDLELSRRAEQLLRKIEGRVEAARLLAGKRVRLVGKDVSVLEALQQLETQSGFRFSIRYREEGWARRKVTLDTGETTFWDALARLCHAGGFSEEPDDALPSPEDGYVSLTDGRAKALPTHIGGALRLRALPTTARVPVAPEEPLVSGTGGAQTGFLLAVSPEPQVPWHGVAGLRITRAVDERGQVLRQTEAYVAPLSGAVAQADRPVAWDGGTGQPIALRSSSVAVPVRLAPGQQPSKRLKEVEGILTIRLSVVRELLTVRNVLQAAGATVEGEQGRFVKVLQVSRKGDTLELHAQIQPRGTDAAGVIPFRVVRSRTGTLIMQKVGEESMATLSLHDGTGATVKPQRSERKLTPNPQGGLLIDFHQVYMVKANQLGPLWLTCRGPELLAVDIPFTLRDVPISPAALPPRQAPPTKPATP